MSLFCRRKVEIIQNLLGSRDNFLFTLYPDFNVYPCSGRDKAYQWLNTASFGLPHGIGFGGTKENCRLFIPESLDGCKALGSDLTYGPGSLIDKSYNGAFEIETLEVWGTGGEDLIKKAIAGQGRKRDTVAHNIQQARKVDKAQFANNTFDQEFLLSKTFIHKTRVADDV